MKNKTITKIIEILKRNGFYTDVPEYYYDCLEDELIGCIESMAKDISSLKRRNEIKDFYDEYPDGYTVDVKHAYSKHKRYISGVDVLEYITVNGSVELFRNSGSIVITHFKQIGNMVNVEFELYNSPCAEHKPTKLSRWFMVEGESSTDITSSYMVIKENIAVEKSIEEDEDAKTTK